MSTAATGALHPDLTRLAAEIRDTQANFTTLCAGLSNAQCISHLNSLNRSDFPM